MATSSDNSTQLAAQNRVQWAALQIGLVIVSIAAFIEMVRASSTPRIDAARLCFAAAIFAWFLQMAGKVVYLARQPDDGPRRTGFKTYSVPRRFGIGTLLVVMLAFGLLSAWLRWLSAPVGTVLIVFGIITYIGLLQFIFDRSPRQVSALAGGIPFAVWPIGGWLLDDLHFTSMTLPEIAFTTAYSALSGALIGYVVGATIGGVFMCFAGVHSLFEKRSGEAISKRESSPPNAPAAVD